MMQASEMAPLAQSDVLGRARLEIIPSRTHVETFYFDKRQKSFVKKKQTSERRGGNIAGGQIHGRGAVQWLTPPELLRAFGSFDLDPCSPVNRPWNTAALHYTVVDDGLGKPWTGRVWLNPPYDNQAERWLGKLADHGDGIALIFARTDTKAFHSYIWRRADALLFLRGRVQFYRVDGTLGKCCGAPSVLAAYGKRNVKSLRDAGNLGAFVELRRIAS